MSKNLSIDEINVLLDNKKYWLQTCVDKMPTLTQDEKSSLYNHLTILRSHINVLQNMLNIAKTSGSAPRDMIYWEP